MGPGDVLRLPALVSVVDDVLDLEEHAMSSVSLEACMSWAYVFSLQFQTSQRPALESEAMSLPRRGTGKHELQPGPPGSQSNAQTLVEVGEISHSSA